MQLTKNKTLNTIIQIGLWLLTAVSAFLILKKTDAGSVLMMSPTLCMIAEVFILFLWFFLSLYFIKSSFISISVVVIISWIYLWMHRTALPVLISGLYIFYLILLGEAFLSICNAGRNEDRIKRILFDFLTGSALHISIFCIFNAFGIGGAEFSRILSLCLFAASASYVGVIRYSKKRVSFPCIQLPPEEEISQEKKERLWICLAYALIGAMLLLQAGRINIALDYDSLHYGLRSRYILDTGYGIYENLGSVNDVYVYPKGLEVLALPLNVNVTYGYVLSFSWWMTCGILLCIFYLTEKCRTRRSGIYAAAFAAAIPGIMNMGISAKTDAITVLIQLIAIIGILDDEYIPAGSALLFSLILKPTSLLFSGLIFITAVICIIVKKKKIDLRQWYVSVPVILAFCFITARTVLLAGVPFASAASGIWESLGFTTRYPYDSIDAFGRPENADLIKRLAGFFFCPVTDDLGHVYIAWGGAGTAVMLFFGFIGAKNKMLKLLTAVILAASLISVLALYQVDGNYYMLLYSLAVILFFSIPAEIYRLMIPVLLLNIMMCCVTNWSGAAGLTPAKWNHYGFYDHESDTVDRFTATGNKDIYEYLARDPEQRVLAIADQPECLGFKCNVQSYTDLEGSGGNVYLVKKLDYFKEFLNYAKTDYIYVNDDFLASHSRAAEIVGYMIEDGSLKLIVDEGCNRLYEYVQK